MSSLATLLAISTREKEGDGRHRDIRGRGRDTPRKWVEKYVKLHAAYPHAAGICSKDIYLDPNGLKLKPTPDDRVGVRLYR